MNISLHADRDNEYAGQHFNLDAATVQVRFEPRPAQPNSQGLIPFVALGPFASSHHPCFSHSPIVTLMIRHNPLCMLSLIPSLLMATLFRIATRLHSIPLLVLSVRVTKLLRFVPDDLEYESSRQLELAMNLNNRALVPGRESNGNCVTEHSDACETFRFRVSSNYDLVYSHLRRTRSGLFIQRAQSVQGFNRPRVRSSTRFMTVMAPRESHHQKCELGCQQSERVDVSVSPPFVHNGPNMSLLKSWGSTPTAVVFSFPHDTESYVSFSGSGDRYLRNYSTELRRS
ncbi:hypothetical protein BJ322DRAFT_7676 [Thelephora terrestris]|uniref:Uncharacterized protein n=1 Tax=Thelephora terrestris TaxID=56493 RepID=A0A9P6HNY6_9AGAM|nr:hypothetical protein BJ322DRAFT_7676 [Thelephora terrestris]